MYSIPSTMRSVSETRLRQITDCVMMGYNSLGSALRAPSRGYDRLLLDTFNLTGIDCPGYLLYKHMYSCIHTNWFSQSQNMRSNKGKCSDVKKVWRCQVYHHHHHHRNAVRNGIYGLCSHNIWFDSIGRMPFLAQTPDDKNPLFVLVQI